MNGKMNGIKKLLFVIVCLILILPVTAAQEKAGIRVARLLNFDWKFRQGDDKQGETFFAPAFDDTSWRTLDLPHDFQFEQEWDPSAGGARGFKAMGAGWYRKSFQAEPSWKGKRVLLDFEGIMLTGDVWFNGVKVGGTDYGYLGFEVDITRHLNYQGENLIAVKAHTGKKENSRWYTGGGLFRDVRLMVKDSIAVARHGVFVTTPEITEQNAEVNVQVEVEGLKGKRLNVEILAKIFAPDGRQVAETRQSTPEKSKKKTEEVLLPVVHIASPQLWSCETPHLYSVEVSLIYKGEILDRVTEHFGIRTLEYSPDFGFRLNGEKVILKGISNHHDLGAVGIAAYESAIERQFKTLKSFGYNHIRTSHNPYSESFLRLADQYGILIVDELFDKWSQQYAGGRLPWAQLWPVALVEWIKRDRNHPSVVMWSLGNELQVQEDWTGYNTGDWGITAYRILDVMVKRYDSTRPTTVAMFPARAGAMTKEDPEFNIKVIPPELSTVTEIASYNYRYPSFPEYAGQFPHLIFYQSEASTSELGKAFYGMDLDKVVGLAWWGAIEYWGESDGWPQKGWHYSFFDHALNPYPQAYLVKSMFSREPTVHIAIVDKEFAGEDWNDQLTGKTPMSSHWNRKKGDQLTIYTFTNAEEVELLLNGKSLGVKKNNVSDPARRNAVLWSDIPYERGKILAIARSAGKEIARHQLETTGKAVALRLEAENDHWKADGMALQYVKVYAVDSKNRVVPETKGEVRFELTGDAARLLAVDNGDHVSDELFSGNKRKLHNGFAMAILRSGQKAGTVKIKAVVPGLEPAEKILNVRLPTLFTKLKEIKDFRFKTLT